MDQRCDCFQCDGRMVARTTEYRHRDRRRAADIERKQSVEMPIDVEPVVFDHADVDEPEPDQHPDFQHYLEESIDTHADIADDVPELSPSATDEEIDNSIKLFVLNKLDKKLQAGETQQSITGDFQILKNSPLIPQRFRDRLPSNYTEAHHLVSDMLGSVERWDACCNDCVLFRGKYKNAKRCPFCSKARTESRVFRYFPIMDRIRRLFTSPTLSQLIQYHASRASPSPGDISDIYDGTLWNWLYRPFARHDQDLAFGCQCRWDASMG